MKISNLYLGLIILAETATAADFTNLDFEAANLPVLPPGQSGSFVPVSQALPGWSAYLGTTPADQILYNNFTLGTAVVSIQGPNSPAGPPLEGSFSAVLMAGFHEPSGGLVTVSVAQTGLVPADAQSILFRTESPPFTFVGVSLNGVELTPVLLPTLGLYAADVSQFAGNTADLRFTTANSFIWLDSISFSSTPIPEPSSWALLTGGLLCLAGFIRKRASRNQ